MPTHTFRRPFDYRVPRDHIAALEAPYIFRGAITPTGTLTLKTITTRDADVITEDLMYIESVQYTEPVGLQLTGGDDNRLNVFLAQKGYVKESDLADSLRSEFRPKNRDVVISSGTGISYEDFMYPPGEVPICGIIMWCGSIESIPEAYALCDGTNGTPDLRDRFVVGAGTTYNPGDTGGQNTIDIEHNHGPGTLNTDNDAHTHGPGSLDTDNDSHTHNVGTLTVGLPTVSQNVASGLAVGVAASNHLHPLTGASANDTHDHAVNAGVTASDSHDHDVNSGVTANTLSTTQDILPLYYSLAYIMRIL